MGGGPPTRAEFLRLAVTGTLTVVLLAASAVVLAAGAGPGGGAGEAPPGAAEQVAGVTPERGRTVFLAKGCASCHSAPGVTAQVPVGPDLTQLRAAAATRRPGLSAEAYVRESVLEPQAYFAPGYPGSASGVSSPGSPQMPKLAVGESELDALVAFLLGAQPGP